MEVTSLRPSDVAAVLAALIQSGDNVCLIGPPGVGKSSLIAQAAQATNHDLIISLPSVEDVTEPGGLPWFAEDHSYATKVLFGQAHKAVNAQVPTVWHWEDFGQAAPSVQAAYMQWAWAREVNGYRLPDHVSITMATNRRTDKAGVSGILEPVKGRFTLIHMASDLDDFCNNLFTRGQSEYGLSEDIIVASAAFLRFRPELLNAFEPSADLTNSPTERNWVAAMRHADQNFPKHIEHALVAGRVGDGPAAEYIGFIRTQRSMPSLDGIIMDPDKAVIPDEPSIIYAVAIGLASKAEDGNFARIAKYATRLDQAGHGEFSTLLVRDSIRRKPSIQNTKAFIQIASTDIGKLMTGRAV